MPAETVFGGTVRTFEPERAAMVSKKIEEAVQGVCALYGTAYEYHYTYGYPVLANTEKETGIVQKAVEKLGKYRFVSIPPTPVAEDFGYYLRQAPGCFFRVGIHNDAKGTIYPLHNDHFALDEDALRIGFETMLAVYLNETGQL
jgi:amidohydrolase